MKRTMMALPIAALLSGCASAGGEEGEGEGETGDCSTTPTDFSTDQTLRLACSPYTFDGSVEVSGGATLTIEAGTELRFPSGEWLQIDEARLVARGTQDQKIIFTDTGVGTPGAWLGIRMRAPFSGTVLEHVDVQNAGGDQFGQKGAIDVVSISEGAVALSHVLVTRSATAGLALSADNIRFATFDDIHVTETDAAMYLFAGSLAAITQVVTTTASRIDVVGGTIAADTTLLDHGVPYIASDDIDVEDASSPTLTLNPGVELRFPQGSWLSVGDGSAGRLVATGTAADPVVIASIDPAGGAGGWLGIQFSNDALSGNVLSNVLVKQCGEGRFGLLGCIGVTAGADRISITDTRIEDSATAAVFVSNENGQFASFARNTFVRTAIGLDLHANVVGSIEDAVTTIDVPRNNINGGNINRTATWVGQAQPWIVASDLEIGGTIDESPIVTLGAGSELRFSSGRWLQVGEGIGGLVTTGTVAAPVVLRSVDAAGVAAAWLGVRIGDNVLSGTALRGVEIREAGEDRFGMKGGITFARTVTADVVIEASFQNNAQSDIYIDCGSTPTINSPGAAIVTNPDC